MAQGLPIKLPWEDITMSELVLVKTNIAGYFFDGFLEVNFLMMKKVFMKVTTMM